MMILKSMLLMAIRWIVVVVATVMLGMIAIPVILHEMRVVWMYWVDGVIK